MNNEDLENLNKVALHYKQSTGVNCVFVQNTDTNICTLCQQQNEACTLCHKDAISRGVDFGGSFIYLCPKDLMFWSSPVLLKGEIIGAFIAGPVISVDPEELDIPELKDYELKVIPPDIAYSLSRTLFMCSSFIFSESNQIIKQNQQMLSMTSAINEAIQEFKEKKQNNSLKELFQSLHSSTKIGNEKLSKKLFSSCVSICLSSYDQSIPVIKNWVNMIINTMLSGALSGQADETEAFKEALQTEALINNSESRDEILTLADTCRKNFCRMISKTIIDKGFNPIILKSLYFMQNNLSHPISELDVAKNANLSISHFSRLFNSEVGMSFSKYMNKIRTERAKELLVSSNMSILEICEATGFEEQSYFTRIFKNYQGMSPNAFRLKTIKYPDENLEIHN